VASITTCSALLFCRPSSPPSDATVRLMSTTMAHAIGPRRKALAEHLFFVANQGEPVRVHPSGATRAEQQLSAMVPPMKFKRPRSLQLGPAKRARLPVERKPLAIPTKAMLPSVRKRLELSPVGTRLEFAGPDALGVGGSKGPSALQAAAEALTAATKTGLTSTHLEVEAGAPVSALEQNGLSHHNAREVKEKFQWSLLSLNSAARARTTRRRAASPWPMTLQPRGSAPPMPLPPCAVHRPCSHPRPHTPR
jgi:hypothetical protein